MFWAIIWTFIWSISRVLFKKTTYYKLSPELNDLIGLFWWFVWICILFFLWMFDIILKSVYDYILIVAVILFFIPVLHIRTYVLQKEKISSLIPYQNTSSILTILLAYLFLWERVSLITLIIFIGIIVLLILSSTAWKKITFNKNILLFLLAECIIAIYNVCVAYILIGNASSTYFIVYILLSTVVLSAIVLYQIYVWIRPSFLDKTFFVYRILASLGWTSWLIWIILISEYWIIVSTLLWFLWLAVMLMSSYFLYKDIPDKKDISIICIVSILVTLWFMYR